MTSGVQETNRAMGAFEMFDGPCCEDINCRSRDAWPYPGETHEQFIARLRSYFRGPLSMPMEAQHDGN